MTRSDLAREIAKKTGLSQRQAENLVISFCAEIVDALAAGKKVVYSNFGTFYTVHYPSKVIYHPKLGAEKKMIMLPTNAAKWLPSGNIRRMVDAEEAPENPTMHKAKKIEAKPEILSLEPDEVEEKNEIKPPLIHPDHKEKEPVASAPPIDDTEDDLNKYLEHKKKAGPENSEPVNIYDELLQDGSHEISTVKGAIRVHHDKETEKKQIDKIQNEIPAENNNVEIKSPEVEKSKVEANVPEDGPFSIIKQKLGIGDKVEKPEKTEDDNSKKDLESSDLESVKPEKNAVPIEEATKENPDGKVSLKDAGIFSTNTNMPAKKQTENQAEEKINKIKGELNDFAEKSKINKEPEPEKIEINKKPASAEKESLPEISNTKKNIKYRDLSKIAVPKEILSKLPEKMARRYKAVPVEEKNGIVTVAMVDPEDIEAKEILKRIFGENIEIVLTTESDINYVLSQYQGLEGEVSSAVESAEGVKKENIDKKVDEKKAKIDATSDDAPAARIVSSLLKRAIRDKASDVHIEPTENEVDVRFRLDGILKKKVALPLDVQSSITSRIKILSNMKIDEQRLPQDGRFTINIDERKVDFRVSTMPTSFGEKIVMRILDKQSGILTIEQLGLRGSGLKILEENLKKSHGMTLVTGPTGSGKTTTLYAMIDKMYSEGINIVTLEDPIEYQMKGINQSQVNSEIGFTFANGLRSLVRQDPDIIMLGEIRDNETADMAVHAALTGHVVLSTLHTNDAAGAAPRMIDMKVEPFLLTSSIIQVIGQRLGRKICEDCKEEVKIPDAELKLIQDEIAKMPEAEKAEVAKKSLKFYKGKGCNNCENSGYRGRIGIFEVLNFSEEIKDLVQKRASSEEITRKAVEQGMLTMFQDGIFKAIDGLTSVEEIFRITKE